MLELKHPPGSAGGMASKVKLHHEDALSTNNKQIRWHSENQRNSTNTLGSRILAIFLQQACFVLGVSNNVKL